MHQPDYRDESGKMGMPWVFLHAIKDYYDMPWILSRYDGVKSTFNITIPLIEQLKIYEDYGAKRDRFLTIWQKEPYLLSNKDKEYIIKIIKSTQYETMIKPLARFDELFHQDSYSDSEFIELETLFILSWCGNYLRRENSTIKTLLQKARGYNSSDKQILLDELLSFIPTILPFYAKLKQEGKISLATTPLNHPILPLLIDMKNATISNPNTPIPPNHFSLSDDAKEQVKRAIKIYQDTFGFSPTGFWPAEGAVDEESIKIYKESGLEWIATDEAILFASIENQERSHLYKNWNLSGINIAFRDHSLSDLIGFTYKFWDAKMAVDDLLSKIEAIDREVVSIILDGENAWEFYPNNAIEFFEILYHRLSSSTTIMSATMDEISKMPSDTLSRLHPGSWINGTFDTWVGHPDKNRAWELIFDTRRDYEHHKESITQEKQSKIIEHFLVAQCSDWFWWYGDTHHTEFALEFDTLFRKHLISIYELMDMPPPSTLFIPIASAGDSKAFESEPKFDIYPIIDGRESSFFEWLGSGMIDESKIYSTMDRVRGPIDTIYWGKNSDYIFIRLDGNVEALDRIDIYIDSKEPIKIDATEPTFKSSGIEVAIDSIIEISISQDIFANSELAVIRLEILNSNKILQTLPGTGELRVALDDNISLKNWFV